MTEQNGIHKLEQVSVRLRLCEETPLYSTEEINTPRKAIDVMKDMMRQLDREYVCIVNLDNGNRPINFNIVSIGSINASLVTMRELLKSSILSNASSLIMLHSHPSYRTEKPLPSKEDNMTTLNVMMATELMGINLQDHVVVAGGSGAIYSYRAELKDKFSIEGLQEIIGLNREKPLIAEPSVEYKPLAKVEELEEQNYNQIDNVLNNMSKKDQPVPERPKPLVKQEKTKTLSKEDRPSLLERMDVMQAELIAENAERAITRQKIRTERTV